MREVRKEAKVRKGITEVKSRTITTKVRKKDIEATICDEITLGDNN